MQVLKNSGFEEGMPNNWQETATGTTHRFTYPEQGIPGSSSVAIEYQIREVGKRAYWYQDVPIDHTKKYNLSGWVKTQNIISDTGGAIIQADWKDVNGGYLSTSAIMIYQKGTIEWKQFQADIVPHPNTARATIILVLNDCSGKVWFDDLSLSEIIIRYKCINGQCVEDPTGTYNSLADCQATLKYACINGQCVVVCSDYPGVKYNTLADCQAALKYACINGQCTVVCPDYPGVKYNTLADCRDICGHVPPGYRLVFEDRFSGTSLDTTKWTKRQGSYTIENGNLVLQPSCDIRGINISPSGGCASPKYQFKYGYVEFRAKLADTTNKGLSNQLWFVSCGGQTPRTRQHEIDITETASGAVVPGKPNTGINVMNMSIHAHMGATTWYQYNNTSSYNSGIDLSKGYHIYGCEWTPTYVKWFLDGVERKVITNSATNGSILIPDEYMYLIMGLCARPVTADPKVCWPATEPNNNTGKMYVDYVKVYQKL